MRNAELHRLIENLIRLGTIAEVDHARARVRVRSGEMLTTWLPWTTPRAGETADWDPPTVGEQVVLLSPGGEPAAGIVITGIYQRKHPAPSSDPGVHRRVYPDGAVFEYDHAASHWRVTLPGSVSVDAPGGTTWTGDIHHVGNLTHQGDCTRTGNSTLNGAMTVSGAATLAGPVAMTGPSATHNGTNIGANHVHGGVEKGHKTSGGPQ